SRSIPATCSTAWAACTPREWPSGSPSPAVPRSCGRPPRPCPSRARTAASSRWTPITPTCSCRFASRAEPGLDPPHRRMHLRHLRLLDFRSWPLLELELEPGVTTLVGRNGHGKTNVVEAIGVLATLGSHRVASDAPLLRTGADTAVVGALAHAAGRELTVERALSSGKANRARLSTSPCRRRSDIRGVVQSVLFAPEDLTLVRGEPGEPRRMLDDLLTQRRPAHGAALTEYSSVLRQRTALLKSAAGSFRRGRGEEAQAALDTLDVWDGRLAHLGARIVSGRVSLLQQLRPLVVDSYHRLAPESRPADLAYRFRVGTPPPEPELTDPEFVEVVLLSELARRRDEEIDRGVSLVGPHR